MLGKNCSCSVEGYGGNFFPMCLHAAVSTALKNTLWANRPHLSADNGALLLLLFLCELGKQHTPVLSTNHHTQSASNFHIPLVIKILKIIIVFSPGPCQGWGGLPTQTVDKANTIYLTMHREGLLSQAMTSRTWGQCFLGDWHTAVKAKMYVSTFMLQCRLSCARVLHTLPTVCSFPAPTHALLHTHCFKSFSISKKPNVACFPLYCA